MLGFHSHGSLKCSHVRGQLEPTLLHMCLDVWWSCCHLGIDVLLNGADMVHIRMKYTVESTKFVGDVWSSLQRGVNAVTFLYLARL